MPQLLIRDVPAQTRQALKIRAIKNGRSQNAEALEILNSALMDTREPWIDLVAKTRDEVGGVDLELPSRELPRDFTFEE